MKKAKRLVPKLRIPKFNVEDSLYKKQSFEEIFRFSTGKNIKQSEASPEFETPCIRYGELYHMYNEVVYEIINRTNLSESELVFSEGNEILLPSAGEDPLDIGSASALTLKGIAIGRTINILRPKKENVYSQIYASYYINEKLRKEIAKLAKGVSISNVYNSDLKKLNIILPSLPEQQKIANFLTAVDIRLQSLEKKKGLLEEYKKGVMQKIFKQEIRFKDENGEDFPEWMEKRLGEVAIKKSSNIAANKIEDNFGDYIIYGAAGILKRVDFYEEKNDYIGIVKDGAGVGRVSYCEGKSSVLATMDIIKPKKNLNTYFLYCLLEQINYRIYITGSTIPHIYFKDYKIERVGVPSQEEQTKIANFLSAIDDKIGLASKQIEKTEAYKKGLLQQLFV